MTNKELMECIKAEMEGKKIECYDFICTDNGEWEAKNHEGWNTGRYIYRIATEPPKREGKWVRKEIVKKTGIATEYICGMLPIDWLARTPGFGGIEYRSPWSAEHKLVISAQPVLFEADGDWHTVLIGPVDFNIFRLGIPVAAWFWEGGE